MRGRGFWNKIQKFGNKANGWLKKSRFISNSLKQYAPGLTGALAGELVKSVGYGRRRRKVRVRRRHRRGGALRLAGGCKKKDIIID